jgi:hypothetical protein
MRFLAPRQYGVADLGRDSRQKLKANLEPRGWDEEAISREIIDVMRCAQYIVFKPVV